MEKKDFSKKKTIITLLIGVLFCTVIACIVFSRQVPKMKEFGTSGKFEETVVKQKTEEILQLFSNGEYQKILDEYAGSTLKEDVKAEDFQKVAEQLGNSLGEIREIEFVSLAEMERGGILYTVAESRVIYENITVRYTFSFNEKMEFTGIYLEEEVKK